MRRFLLVVLLVFLPLLALAGGPPVVVSATPLTPTETQFLNESSDARNVAAISSQLVIAQQRVDRLRKAHHAAVLALQASLARVLASRTPPVPVPAHALVVRQRLKTGQDALLVLQPQ